MANPSPFFYPFGGSDNEASGKRAGNQNPLLQAANRGLKEMFSENRNMIFVEMCHFELPGIKLKYTLEIQDLKVARVTFFFFSYGRGQRGNAYQNISFVYWRGGFVLHAASRGDKVRATRSTFSRNRKCCREHQLSLRRSSGWKGAGFGLPRRDQIKRLLCPVRLPPRTKRKKIYIFKVLKVLRETIFRGSFHTTFTTSLCAHCRKM